MCIGGPRLPLPLVQDAPAAATAAAQPSASHRMDPVREVFVDESSQNGHAFMVLGAMIVPGPNVHACEQAFSRLLSEAQMHGEFKWGKVSRSKLPVYKNLAAEHFRLVSTAGVEFIGLIVETRGLDHNAYNEGDPELGFNKFLFQILWHGAGLRYGLNERIVVHLDSRTANRDLTELTLCLNRKATHHFGGPARAPFARVAFRDSKNSRILQCTDLLAGAIAWHKNDRDSRQNPSSARIELANEIARLAGRRRLGGGTPRGEWGLNTWNFRLRPTRRGAR